MIFKTLVKSMIRSLGYELRKVTRDSVGKNAFYDQHMLLSDISVQTIFDIGANIGNVTAEYNRLFPEAAIYGFEPFPETFEKFCKKYEGNSLVKPIQSAVFDKVGKAKFYVNQNSATNSLLPATDTAEYEVDPPNDIRNTTIIEVPITTIDDFCKQESINEIQLLKMDIQGGELMALKGATEKLSQKSILLIYTEILFVPIYKGQAQFYEIYNFLSDYGYTLFDMYNFVYRKNGQVKWGDALFVGPQIRASVLSTNSGANSAKITVGKIWRKKS